MLTAASTQFKVRSSGKRWKFSILPLRSSLFIQRWLLLNVPIIATHVITVPFMKPSLKLSSFD